MLGLLGNVPTTETVLLYGLNEFLSCKHSGTTQEPASRQGESSRHCLGNKRSSQFKTPSTLPFNTGDNDPSTPLSRTSVDEATKRLFLVSHSVPIDIMARAMAVTSSFIVQNYSLSPEFCIITAQAPSRQMTDPINFGKLLPGSTFIRELVPFCPCSVYPGPNGVILWKAAAILSA
ncbi:hypothetical protein CDAR_460001 [Caerostris darwini]|uniref:Uncharacterized protein n=1 Tax=Caerostris darwini TaxID=1538125 RepID=A0AAV4QPC5_9ARAC|nr:hypothetical protein CDAR_460001 [Caerostris darwini]